MIYAHIYIFKKFFIHVCCWRFWLFFADPLWDDEWPKKYDVESWVVPALVDLGRILIDGDVMAIFCLKKINNISGIIII